MMKILYVEGDSERRKNYAAQVARDYPKVAFHVAADMNQAMALYDQSGPFDLIISGLVYPGLMKQFSSGIVDFYNHNCDENGTSRIRFVLFYDPVKDDDSRHETNDFVALLHNSGYCTDIARVYREPNSTISDVVRREMASLIPTRPVQLAISNTRKFQK